MSNQTIQWFSTSKAAAWQTHNVTATKESANLTITGETHQLVEGFGGCFNELGYVALNHLGSDEREQVLHSLFHPEGEHKFTICQLPIGASDYALEWYSHNRRMATWICSIFPSNVIISI